MTLFDGIELTKRKAARLKALPPIPVTGWKAPNDFPNLSNAVAIGLDCETKDPELMDAGPGWGRGKGHIVGVSLAAIDLMGNTGKWYFPMRHEVDPSDNMDPAQVMGFVGHVLHNPNTRKIGANLMYDMGWLSEAGVYVQGELNDIQFSEALIDNEARVSLDHLAAKYLGTSKTSDRLEEWITRAYKPKKSAWRGNIYRSPPSLAGAYAEDDALLPIQIWQAQQPLIEREGLTYLNRLENDLIPLYIQMRRAGVTVNIEKASLLKLELEGEIEQLYARIYDEYGVGLESTDSRQVAKLLDVVGVKYPYTKAGNPSIEKEWLDALDHPVGTVIHEIREREKIVGTFIGSYILGKHVNGKLYPQFHPLRGEANGTMVGRFSSSDPNLQNIPSRTELGKRVRECFEPDPGHHHWRKHDYSQIHYRILADKAVDRVDGRAPEFEAVQEFWRSPIGTRWGGQGSADALRDRYINDPDTDYHLDVYHNVAPLLGWSTTDEDVIKVKRRPIKNVNFGLLYGQGGASLAYKAGFSKHQADEFFAAYHAGAPYVKPTMEAIELEARSNHYVETLLGRRIRFSSWEPMDNWQKKAFALPYEKALATYGSFIKLAFTYRAINYKFQGSEPDLMKQGMLDCWRSGVFDFTGVPRLTVHDELDFSVVDDSPAMQEAFRFIQHTMANAIKLRVPVKVDASTGPNWGKAD